MTSPYTHTPGESKVVKWKDSFFSPVRGRRSSEFMPRPRPRLSEYVEESKINFNINNGDDNDHIPCSSKTASALDSLCSAIENRDPDTVAEILMSSEAEDVDVNQVVPGLSMSLLHLSVGFSDNDPTVVEVLLTRGGDPNNTSIEDGLSPLHLSAVYDHDRVMRALMEAGGNPKLKSADGESCYDIVKRNVEEEMLEKCFSFLFTKSRGFRKSIVPSRLPPPEVSRRQDSGSECFHSCDSLDNESGMESRNEAVQNAAKRLFPKEYDYLMTEDESTSVSSSYGSTSDDDDDGRRNLTTIQEESGIGLGSGSNTSSSSLKPYSFSRSPSPPLPAVSYRRGIGSITVPQLLMTEDSISESVLSDRDRATPSPSSFSSSSSNSSSASRNTSATCVNSTPPLTPLPTEEELRKLQEQLKTLNIPVTPLTYGVMSNYTKCENRLENLMKPKQGSINFSSELRAGLENLGKIHEYGKHKVDYLQNATPTANASKSFYNYLLLDPRKVKNVNFSGDNHKASIINNCEKFEKFLLSIFYIGKAHGKRPLQHLVEAKAKFVEIGKKPLKNGEKIDKILEIWRAGMGVVIVSLFHHSSEREANVNEACMIDAMGLTELTNLVKGSCRGTAASGWSQKTKNQLGSLLLYKAYCSFVCDNQKQFYPHDFE